SASRSSFLRGGLSIVEGSITLWNFDGVYKKQSFYRQKDYDWLELESVPSTNLLCEKDTLRDLANALVKRRSNCIHYLGSGNYHYVSYILQSRINKPYTLILFDHHTDSLPSPSESLISCGSWVLDSLKNLPMLKKVLIIGVAEEALRHIPASIRHKVVIYTEKSLQQHLPTIIHSMLNNIPTDSIYISIDKDVLDPEDALTSWDHGTLRLKQMMKMIKALFQHENINGIDVCGEYPVNPANDYRKADRDAIDKNDRANGYMLEYFQKWTNLALSY